MSEEPEKSRMLGASLNWHNQSVDRACERRIVQGVPIDRSITAGFGPESLAEWLWAGSFGFRNGRVRVPDDDQFLARHVVGQPRELVDSWRR